MDEETIRLIVEMKTLNPNWGAQKISDELSKIGYRASKKTVLKYLEFYGLHQTPPRKGPSWREFINNHKFRIGIDFTSLISLTGRQLHIFVMINLDTRKLVFINVTYHPDLEWVTQQFRNAFLEVDDYPSLCICDNDTIFHKSFQKMLKDYFNIRLRRIPFGKPYKNGITERFHLSLKSEGFKNVVPINLLQAQRIVREYQDYYNKFRPHQGIFGEIPDKTTKNPQSKGSFQKIEHLGGKITSFERKVTSVILKVSMTGAKTDR